MQEDRCTHFNVKSFLFKFNLPGFDQFTSYISMEKFWYQSDIKVNNWLLDIEYQADWYIAIFKQIIAENYQY